MSLICNTEVTWSYSVSNKREDQRHVNLYKSYLVSVVHCWCLFLLVRIEFAPKQTFSLSRFFLPLGGESQKENEEKEIH